LFNRGAWAGVSNTSLGEIRLGRQGTNTIGAICTIDQHGCYSGFSGGGILFSGQASTGATNGGWMLANPTRGGVQASSTANSAQYGAAGVLAASAGVDATRYVKAVRYSLPTLVTGLSVNATYAYGTTQSATAAAGGNSSGVDATYANGPMAVVFAYQKADKDAGGTVSGELTTIGGTYDLGVAKLGAGIQQEKAAGAGALFTKGDSYALTATVPMGAFTPYVKYGEHKYNNATGTNAKISNVGVRYALSKTSLVYVDYVNNAAALVDTAKSSKSMASIGLQTTF